MAPKRKPTPSSDSFETRVQALKLDMPDAGAPEKKFFADACAHFMPSATNLRERTAALVWARHAVANPDLWDSVADPVMQKVVCSLYKTKAVAAGAPWHTRIAATVEHFLPTPQNSPEKADRFQKVRPVEPSGAAPPAAKRHLAVGGAAGAAGGSPPASPPEVIIADDPAPRPLGELSVEDIRTRLTAWQYEELYAFAHYNPERRKTILKGLELATKAAVRHVDFQWPLWGFLFDFSRAMAGSLYPMRDAEILLHASRWRSAAPGASSVEELHAFLLQANRVAQAWQLCSDAMAAGRDPPPHLLAAVNLKC